MRARVILPTKAKPFSVLAARQCGHRPVSLLWRKPQAGHFMAISLPLSHDIRDPKSDQCKRADPRADNALATNREDKGSDQERARECHPKYQEWMLGEERDGESCGEDDDP